MSDDPPKILTQQATMRTRDGIVLLDGIRVIEQGQRLYTGSIGWRRDDPDLTIRNRSIESKKGEWSITW